MLALTPKDKEKKMEKLKIIQKDILDKMYNAFYYPLFIDFKNFFSNFSNKNILNRKKEIKEDFIFKTINLTSPFLLSFFTDSLD